MVEPRREEDLVLPPGTYAHTMDTTTGLVRISTGPNIVGRGGTDKPVKYDYKSKRFERVTLEEAGQQCLLVPQGHYAQLWNPSKSGKHPEPKERENTPELLFGERVNISGPKTFAPWPGQSVKVIAGHRLQSNQYLQVRVYDADAARKNMDSAFVETTTEEDDKKSKTKKNDKRDAFGGINPKMLTAGKILIIKGTDVSFFIPPTGMEVVPEPRTDVDNQRSRRDRYVREAQTLEALQYCILVDENGTKSYPRGPAVVFPEATQEFFTKEDKEGNLIRVFQAIELNEIQGIHIKVIAPYVGEYTDPKTGDVNPEHQFKEGEEFFLKEVIYYPREEHSVVKYDGVTKHFATAIPEGEGRYVMNRTNSEIQLVRGPAMLLPNPVNEVIVQRALSDQQSKDWYPDNDASLAFNRTLREVAASTPTTRGGTVSNGQLDRKRGVAQKGASLENLAISGRGVVSNDSSRSFAGGAGMEASSVSRNTDAVMTTSERAATYSQPRKIIFGDKFNGVPTIAPELGFGVMVVDKKGGRKVIVGPKSYLMAYGETLQVLSLSTGKPKNTDRLIRTVYLELIRQVTDVIDLVTADHVPVQVKLSYQVSFEGLGDDEKMESWFSRDNYVKFMCDRLRSILKAYARKTKIADFYSRAEDAVRDVILGEKSGKKDEKRPGKLFAENNMRIFDVEVLGVEIRNQAIRTVLEQQQVDTFTTTIKVQNAERDLEVTQKTEEIARKRSTTIAQTKQHSSELKAQEIARTLAISLGEYKSKLDLEAEELKLQDARNTTQASDTEATIVRNQRIADFEAGVEKVGRDGRIIMIEKETEALKARFGAFDENLTTALLSLSDNATLEKLAFAVSPQALIGGDNVVDALQKIFKGTPAEAVMKQLTARMTDNGVGGRGGARLEA